MTNVAYITNAPPQSGMGRPARAIKAAMEEGDIQLDAFFLDGAKGELQQNDRLLITKPPLFGARKSKPVQWWRLARSLPKDGYDLWHLTNQSLSFIPRRPAVITVYDLIELLDPQQAFSSLIYRYLYRGLPDATRLICISRYTKKTVQDTYGIPDEKISLVPLAAGLNFTPMPDVKQSVAYRLLLSQHRLKPEQKIILYVGSEHPRKNLGVLVEAFARVRVDHPSAVLLKVGDAGLPAGRNAFLAALDRASLRPHVRMLQTLNDEDLRLIYAAADVFVFPSTFEGFGLPPLEAMACGCPVVTSNATSLPEVVGDAGLLCEPHDVEAFAAGINRILEDKSLAGELRAKGLKRAARFTWPEAARQTAEVYRRTLEESAQGG